MGLKENARKLFCICRGPTSHPDYNGKNQVKSSAPRTGSFPPSTIDDEEDHNQRTREIASSTAQETAPGVLASTGNAIGKGAHNAVYGVGAAVAAAGAAVTGADLAARGIGEEEAEKGSDGVLAARGIEEKKNPLTKPHTKISGATRAAKNTQLSSDGVKKVNDIEKHAQWQVAEVDLEAAQKLSSIFDENGIDLEISRVGKTTGVVSVTGASAKAKKAGLPESASKKVAGVERRALEDIEAIDEEALDQVGAVYKDEGVKFDRPGVGASDASAAKKAAAAGLSASSVKKVTSAEKKAQANVAKTDAKAMKEVVRIYKENGLKPDKPKCKKFSPRTGAAVAGGCCIMGAAAAAARSGLEPSEVDRVKAIEKSAVEEIDGHFETAEAKIAEVYAKEEAKTDKTPKRSVNKAAAVGAGVVGAGVGAAALSSASKKKVESIEEKAITKIQKSDEKAMKDISAIYQKRGVEMKDPEPRTNTSALACGAVAGSVAVVGAAGAAAAVGLSSDDVDKIKTIEKRAVDDIDSTADKASDDVAKVYEKEGVVTEKPKASLMTAAAAAAGLGVAAQKKVGGIEQRLAKRIESIDAQAVEDIESVYRESGMKMEKPSPKKTKVGNTTAALAVTGATAVAAKARMGSLDLARVDDIEVNATEQIKSIDEQAGDNIAEVYESGGKWYQRPGASRAAALAASAGLGLVAVKQIASVEEGTEKQMEAVDQEAAGAVAEADKAHAAKMYKYAKEGKSEEFLAREETTAAERYASVESSVTNKIVELDQSTANSIGQVYSKEGKELKKSRGPFTARGAAGGTATAAAIAAAARGAENRKQMFAGNTKERSAVVEEESTNTLTSIGNAVHLAVYDVGAGVASAGKTITGADFEGPAEYDARAHYTPEQKARAGCCSGY